MCTHTDRHTGTYTERQTDTYTDRYTHTDTCTDTHRHTDTDTHIHRQTQRHTDRHTDIVTHTHTDRHSVRKKKKERCLGREVILNKGQRGMAKRMTGIGQDSEIWRHVRQPHCWPRH